MGIWEFCWWRDDEKEEKYINGEDWKDHWVGNNERFKREEMKKQGEGVSVEMSYKFFLEVLGLNKDDSFTIYTQFH